MGLKIAEVAGFFNIDAGIAKQIVALIDGAIDPDNYKSVQDWSRQCYNEPSKHEKVFCAVNELLEGFGVEAIWSTDSELHPVAEYVNMGDTYFPTICYCDGEFMLSDWGSLVEKLESEGVEVK